MVPGVMPLGPGADAPQAAARHQQRVEKLCVAAIRALSGERDLHFRGRRLHRGRLRLPLYAPHLHPTLEADDFASFRGAADGLALRLRLSDDGLHRRLAPAEAVPRLVFDMLEQFRVESLAGDEWPGVQRNVQHRFEQWTLAFHHAGLTDSARGLLLLTVAQMARARVTALPPHEAIEDLMEATRAGIAPLLGHGLAGLRRARHDQAVYAGFALQVAQAVARLLKDAGAELDAARAGADPELDERLAFGLLMDVEDSEELAGATEVVLGRGKLLHDPATGYRVFTTAYDRELRPAALLRKEQTDEFRQRLDARIQGQGLNIARLARQLQAVLAAQVREDWVSAQEEGLIDGRRLAQLVTSPAERRLFRQAVQQPQADCVVGMLIDCSGSMRQHVESVAMLVDVLARALDMAGVASEILGFTTAAWNGGRAKRDWQRACAPLHPGRLNEVLHLVVKDGDMPWRHARREVAALLKPDLFREGVDGEALAWAAARLRARAEPRRVLIVLSDGCPMDGATQLANGPQYLDHHLQQVAAQIESAGDIELCAVGVGMDLSAYYGHCQAIDLAAGLGNKVFQEVVAMLGSRGRR